jgi:hypothetical protein
MKIFSSDCTFNYSWDEVSTANWRKYCPWNEKSTHVLAVDILSRRVDPGTGILRTERIITCKNTAPSWISTILGTGDVLHTLETSYVDPQSQKVTMISSNLSASKFISVQEQIVYQPLSTTQTQFVQKAEITALCGGWQKIKSSIEEIGCSNYSENARKGKEGFERVLEMSRRVFSEEKRKEELQITLQTQEMMAA